MIYVCNALVGIWQLQRNKHQITTFDSNFFNKQTFYQTVHKCNSPLSRNAFCNKTRNRTAFVNGLEQDTSTKLTGFTVTKDTNCLTTRGCQRRLLVCSKLITKHATKSAVTRRIQLPGYHDNKFDNK